MSGAKVESIGPYLEPLHKSVVVSCAPEKAFEVFTRRIGDWWPLHAGYSVFGKDSATCVIEPHQGGAIMELAKDGRQCIWGRVITWDPPRGLSFSWFPGREADSAQTVEIRFVEEAAGTRMELEHRDWQTLGAQAAEMREGYSNGWNLVLEKYGDAASAG
ncbi:MAG: SRPBCC family protein [Bryobacteraceae bacterium]|nr:SRPBCC family protein [Bryobacteraceae bacterium]